MLGNDIPAAILSIEQALEIVVANDNPSEASKCCFYLAGAYYCTGETRRSYEVSMRWISFIERCRKQHQLQNPYSWVGLLYSSLGAWNDAEQAIEQAQLFADR